MIAFNPLARAPLAYSAILSGVRWAETTSCSDGTPNSVSTATACFIVSQSESDPITTPITGFAIDLLNGKASPPDPLSTLTRGEGELSAEMYSPSPSVRMERGSGGEVVQVGARGHRL